MDGVISLLLLKLTETNKKVEIQKGLKNLYQIDIWIEADYPKDIQEERRKLIPIWKETRRGGAKCI